MKIFKRLLAIFLVSILCLSVLTSCFEDESDSEVAKDTLVHAPDEILQLYDRGDSVEINETLFMLTPTFQPSEKKDGYISDIALSFRINGYNADFTYFNCFVNVTWTYHEITDANPTGITREFTTTVELDANGNGSYSHVFSLQACRSISFSGVTYTWSGTATKL